MTESSDVPSDPPYSGYSVRPAFYEGYPPPFASPQNGLGTASLLIAVVALVTVWSVSAESFSALSPWRLASPPAGGSSAPKPLITA
jgi:hypothetical protein